MTSMTVAIIGVVVDTKATVTGLVYHWPNSKRTVPTPKPTNPMDRPVTQISFENLFLFSVQIHTGYKTNNVKTSRAKISEMGCHVSSKASAAGNPAAQSTIEPIANKFPDTCGFLSPGS